MKIFKINPQNPEPALIEQAAKIILRDGVIGYPTETVYGLGANALREPAIHNIFRLKQRDQDKPILVIASDTEMINRIVKSIPDAALRLADAFWPGPLTMLFPAANNLPSALLGGRSTIGIRIPDHPVCLELLRYCGVPITSTSANISGDQNPMSAEEVANAFGDQLDALIDGGIATSRMPSTVVDISTDPPKLIRDGVITRQQIVTILNG
ncbi:threonylcarbamoyl-AMP synthase [candidate division KSB1 bacterium]|nr:threonylcarbamoyl-AMP synthase [candidate division KSB1 bacterium]